MKRFFLWLLTPWVLSMLTVLVLALLIWFEGPLLAFAGSEPFASEGVRWILIATLVVLWVAFWIWRIVREKIAALKLSRIVAGQGAAPGATGAPVGLELDAEMAALTARMQEAMQVLRKSKSATGSGKMMYDLPWYMFVGAPGSGKTTALLHSGLKFPLSGTMGNSAIGGVGGTRNCDWWFTDEAVLLDTAGRYTTQDSYAEVDHAAWTGFLSMLRKHRSRRPINGVIVVVSVDDLLQKNDSARKALALAIRGRIKELHEHLGIRFPIYVMVTKCDLLAGFVEFFDPLSREERGQVWGVTFPLQEADRIDSVLDGFPNEFGALEAQLQARVLERMQKVRDVQRRALLYGFPQQFAGVGDPLNQLLHEIFQSTRYEECALLRGVYFTSGTQEGNPIDRVIGSLASAFGIDRQALPANVASGRSYFVMQLLRDVIFREAGLAGANLRLERNRRVLQWGFLSLMSVLLLVVLSARVTSFVRNEAYVLDLGERVEAAAKLAQVTPRTASPMVTLPVLNSLRGLPTGYAQRDDSVPFLMRLGLYQGRKLSPAAVDAYRRILTEALLPRLTSRLEGQLRRGEANNFDYLYEALRAYLMLGERKHFDVEALQAWFEFDLNSNLPDADELQRMQLSEHVAALIETLQLPETAPIRLDPELITVTRLTLARMPLPQRIYERMKKEFARAALPDFSVSGAGGPAASLVLIRVSGAPLTRGVPGMYTLAGYRKFFESIEQTIAEVVLDGWVLDPQESNAILRDVEQTKATLKQLYLNDYIRQWDQYLADVGIAPFASLDEGARLTGILASPDSPLRKFMQRAALETTLQNVKLGALNTTSMVAAMSGKLNAYRKKLEEALGGTPLPPPAGLVVNPVDAHFKTLHVLVGPAPVPGGPPPAPAPLDAMLNMLKEVAVYFDNAERAKRNGTAMPPADVLLKIKRDALDAPAPVGAILQNINNLGGGITSGGDRVRLNAAWAINAAQFCRQAIAGRYPLVRNSVAEVLPEDFGKFFAPGGIMDDFFQKNLLQYVDMSGARWRWNEGAADKVGIPAEVLAEFERAARVRDMFFGSGGKLPSMRFELKPIVADAALTNVLLEIDGQPLTFVAGSPAAPALFQVPSGKGAGLVRFQPTPAGAQPELKTEGPWAWLRMLDRALVEPSPQAERFRLSFNLSDREFVMELVASSVINPFRRDALEQFRCPERL